MSTMETMSPRKPQQGHPTKRSRIGGDAESAARKRQNAAHARDMAKYYAKRAADADREEKQGQSAAATGVRKARPKKAQAMKKSARK